jgi:hypothetical protein
MTRRARRTFVHSGSMVHLFTACTYCGESTRTMGWTTFGNRIYRIGRIIRIKNHPNAGALHE